jgi:hypothetical protein
MVGKMGGFGLFGVVFKGRLSNTWQQTLAIHSNDNHNTKPQQSTSDFDAIRLKQYRQPRMVLSLRNEMTIL